MAYSGTCHDFGPHRPKLRPILRGVSRVWPDLGQYRPGLVRFCAMSTGLNTNWAKHVPDSAKCVRFRSMSELRCGIPMFCPQSDAQVMCRTKSPLQLSEEPEVSAADPFPGAGRIQPGVGHDLGDVGRIRARSRPGSVQLDCCRLKFAQI